MAKEIERRFLVTANRLPPLKKGKNLVQGYFEGTDPGLRIRLQENRAFLTIKSFISSLTREEFEYPIPLVDGKKLLNLTRRRVEKERFYLRIKDKTWSIDFFHGQNSPLVLAEIELKNEKEPFEKPLWIFEEVTEDKRYLSMNLASNPYKKWGN